MGENWSTQSPSLTKKIGLFSYVPYFFTPKILILQFSCSFVHFTQIVPAQVDLSWETLPFSDVSRGIKRGNWEEKGKFKFFTIFITIYDYLTTIILSSEL